MTKTTNNNCTCGKSDNEVAFKMAKHIFSLAPLSSGSDVTEQFLSVYKRCQHAVVCFDCAPECPK